MGCGKHIVIVSFEHLLELLVFSLIFHLLWQQLPFRWLHKLLPCFHSGRMLTHYHVSNVCLMYIYMYDSAGPHENAHRHHVNNELRMLERFG